MTFDNNYTVAAIANREKGAHGGVAILQSNNVISNVRNCFSDNFICAVEVKTATCPVLVICLYIPPKTSNYRPPWKQISESLGKLLQQFNGRTIITGDFNEPTVDLVSFTSTSHNDIESFSDLLIQINFLQIVQDGTHEGGHMLDLVFANFDDLYLPLNYIIKTDFSDHFGVKTCFDLPELNSQKYSSFEFLSRDCYSSISRFLSFSLFSLALDTKSLDFVPFFLKYLDDLLSSYTTMKRSKRNNLPWFYSSHTIHALNKHDNVVKNHWKFPSVLVEELSRDVEVSMELDTAVYLDQFASNNTGASSCFRLIKRLKSELLPTEMRYENTIHNGYPSIANAFNAYFMTVYQPAVGFFDDFEQRTLNELCFTMDDIRAALSQASLGKGFDKIPGDFLRMATDSLTYHVMKLFQSIAETSTYPKLWKKAMIIPTFKTGSKFCSFLSSN